MSTPQDDIGAAIVSTLGASPFTTYIGSVGYGTLPSAAGKSSLGTALVMPRDAADLDDYDGSAQREYTYSVEIRLSNRAMATTWSQCMRDMKNVFRSSSRTLQGNFSDTSTKAHNSTLWARTDLVDIEEPEGDTQNHIFEVTVTLWEATT